jgi:hypothetical protein
VVVGSSNFRQLVTRIPGGHVSVAFELGSDPLVHVEGVRSIFENRFEEFQCLG